MVYLFVCSLLFSMTLLIFQRFFCFSWHFGCYDVLFKRDKYVLCGFNVLCRNLNSKMLTVGGTPAVQCMSVLLPCRWRVSRKGSSEIIKMAEFNEIEWLNNQSKQKALGILYLKYSSRHCYPVDLAVYNAVKAFFFWGKKALLWPIFMRSDLEDRVSWHVSKMESKV